MSILRIHGPCRVVILIQYLGMATVDRIADGPEFMACCHGFR